LERFADWLTESEKHYHDSNKSVTAVFVPVPPPVVESIVRKLGSRNPTNAPSVQYTVTFSEAVSGVTKNAFTAVATGTLAGFSVYSLSGSGDTYTVTVNSGNGEGTLRLNLTNVTGIKGMYQNALLEGHNGDQVFDIDRVPPIVEANIRKPGSRNPTNAESVQYEIEFSEVVTGVTEEAFVPVPYGNVTNPSITSMSGGGDTYTVTVNTGTGDGMLSLQLANVEGIMDLVENPMVSGSTGESYTIDKTPPVVSFIACVGENPTTATFVQYAVKFSEDVTGVNTGAFTAVPGGDLTGPSVTGVSGEDDEYAVTVKTGMGDGTVRLDLTSGGGIEDAAGNVLDQVPHVGQTFTVNNPPFVKSFDNATPGAKVFACRVEFSEPVEGVDSTDFILSQYSLPSVMFENVWHNAGRDMYYIGVAPLTGNGWFELRLEDNDTIHDTFVASCPLGGEGEGNGNASTGCIYASPLMPQTYYISIQSSNMFWESNGGSTLGDLDIRGDSYTAPKLPLVNAVIPGYKYFIYNGHGGPGWLTFDSDSVLNHDIEHDGASYKLVYLNCCNSMDDGGSDWSDESFNAQCVVGWHGMVGDPKAELFDSVFWGQVSLSEGCLATIAFWYADWAVAAMADGSYPDILGDTFIGN